MKCEDVVNVLRTADDGTLPATRAREHLETCAACRSALVAADALRELRAERVPLPSNDAFERAVRHAVLAGPAGKYRSGFWRGTAFGAALAAGIAVVAVGFWLRTETSEPVAAPEVRIALNQARDVTVMLETAEPLAAAEVHVVLSGAIALQGYEQRELRWSTHLDRGVNELTLPIVMVGESGGQLLVEVLHGDKRRTFVVDVRAARNASIAAADRAGVDASMEPKASPFVLGNGSYGDGESGCRYCG
jgi:hypothetical protein